MDNMEKIALCQDVLDKIQEDSRRAVCRLQFSDESFGIADSHLGGIPYLPNDKAYPVGDDGQTLWLCAQINFAQMPQMEGFPKQGILQFFLSDFNYDGGFGLYGDGGFSTVQKQWKVFWYPQIDEEITEADCLAKMPAKWEDAEDIWRVPDKPLKMNFLPVTQEGINMYNYNFKDLYNAELHKRLPDAEDFNPYGELEDETLRYRETPNRMALEKLQNQMGGGGCKIGGYARFEQDDPREYSEVLGEELTEYDTVLFELDGDTFTYPVGGKDNLDIDLNGGVLNFLIRSEDLKKEDFSHILAQWACS